VKLLEFGRSTILFRIDLDVLPPRTLSHKPPFAMNNARIQIDSVCRITERDGGRVHTFVLGGDCKTERVGAERDLFLEPNADFIPIFSDDTFMHIKTFARAGTQAEAYPPGSGEQSDRLTAPITETFVDAHLDLVEREGESLVDGGAIVDAVLSNALIVGLHRLATDRYDVEIEYPVRTINANERDIVYQTDTGPILWPDLDRDPGELLAGLELAFTAANAPHWAQIIVRRRTEIAAGIEVYHYVDSIRVEGIRNEFYRLPDSAPATHRRVDLLANASTTPERGLP
jgi:hypothetical protein